MTGLDEPKPIRILVRDLDHGVDGVDADLGDGEVWVVGRLAGLPVAIAELRPDDAPEARRATLTTLADAADHARASVRTEVRDEDLPRISVVAVSIKTRIESLRRCLEQLEAVDYPDFEIILVDNRTSPVVPDPLPDLVAGLTRTRVVAESRPGISAARNAGVAAASGTVVAFTDDDVAVDVRWLRAFGERFVIDDRADVITGLVLPAELETPAQIWYERFYGGFSGERTFAPLVLESVPGNRARVEARTEDGVVRRRFAIYGIGSYGAGANMAFRTALLRARGFDLALGTGTPARGGEDLDMLVRVLWDGGRLVYDPSAVVWHQHRREYDALVRQMEGNGLGYTAMLCAVIAHDPRHLVGLATQVPVAAWKLTRQNLARLSGRNVTQDEEGQAFPPLLARNEMIGMLEGPLAYVKSRRQSRRLAGRPTAPAAVGSERAGKDQATP